MRTRLLILGSAIGSLGWGAVLPYQYAYAADTRGWGAMVAAAASSLFSVGALVARYLTPAVLKWIVALSFFAVALWTLKPDSADEEEAARGAAHGVLLATIVAFFIAEMGDKTQVATVVLAAHYQPLWQVVAGTTLGMLLANVPVVWLGSRFAARLPLKAARVAAAVLFAALGLWILMR